MRFVKLYKFGNAIHLPLCQRRKYIDWSMELRRIEIAATDRNVMKQRAVWSRRYEYQCQTRGE